MVVKQNIQIGADWLLHAQTKTDEQARDANDIGYTYPSLIGAIRNEYKSSTKHWSYYGIHWHSMQAAIALLGVHQLSGEDKYYDAAIRIGEFLIAQQIHDGDDAGLIPAEGKPGEAEGMVHSVAALSESLPGLYYLYQATGEERWKDALTGAAAGLRRNHI